MSTPLRLSVLAEVRRVMEERGMSQAELARAIGASQVQVSQMFSRAEDAPRGITMGTLERLGEALGVTFTLQAEERR